MTPSTLPAVRNPTPKTGAEWHVHRPTDTTRSGSVAPTTEWPGRCANTPGPGHHLWIPGGNVPQGTHSPLPVHASTERQPSPTPLTGGKA
jgi:hypothetical protein